jgi:hypothetical protein
MMPGSGFDVVDVEHAHRLSRALSCLVTAIADDPEQKHVRCRGVHLYRSGLAGTVRDRPDTANLQTASH